jgi:hypothetical protein
VNVWVLGELESQERLVDVASRLRIDGFGELDAYSPYPVHGIDAALGLKASRVPLIALGGGLFGVGFAYLMQWWTAAVDYPINVGGRPPHSPPAFVPIVFELGVLISALSIFFGLLLLWRLPRPHHPVFEVEEFRSASTHALWVSVRAKDEVEAARAEGRLREWGALTVSRIAEDER